MLTQDQIAYGQQKNREHIWQQCKSEFLEQNGEHAKSWCDHDQQVLSDRYEYLCKQARIKPW